MFIVCNEKDSTTEIPVYYLTLYSYLYFLICLYLSLVYGDHRTNIIKTCHLFEESFSLYCMAYYFPVFFVVLADPQAMHSAII